MRWNGTEHGMQLIPPCGVNADAAGRCVDLEANAGTRRADMLASARTWFMVWSIALLLMLEDDVAMIALMFC